MLVSIEGCSKNIGGPNKTVEINASTFVRGKYYRGHTLKGRWVFGGAVLNEGLAKHFLFLYRTEPPAY
jgi:hypothetical protein